MKVIVANNTFEYGCYEEKVVLNIPLKNIDSLMVVENIKELINKIKKEYADAKALYFLPTDEDNSMSEAEVRSKLNDFINLIKSVEENE